MLILWTNLQSMKKSIQRNSQITVTKIPRNKRFSLDNTYFDQSTKQHSTSDQTFSFYDKPNSRKGIQITRIQRNKTFN